MIAEDVGMVIKDYKGRTRVVHDTNNNNLILQMDLGDRVETWDMKVVGMVKRVEKKEGKGDE